MGRCPSRRNTRHVHEPTRCSWWGLQPRGRLPRRRTSGHQLRARRPESTSPPRSSSPRRRRRPRLIHRGCGSCPNRKSTDAVGRKTTMARPGSSIEWNTSVAPHQATSTLPASSSSPRRCRRRDPGLCARGPCARCSVSVCVPLHDVGERATRPTVRAQRCPGSAHGRCGAVPPPGVRICKNVGESQCPRSLPSTPSRQPVPPVAQLQTRLASVAAAGNQCSRWRVP